MEEKSCTINSGSLKLRDNEEQSRDTQHVVEVTSIGNTVTNNNLLQICPSRQRKDTSGVNQLAGMEMAINWVSNVASFAQRMGFLSHAYDQEVLYYFETTKVGGSKDVKRI